MNQRADLPPEFIKELENCLSEAETISKSILESFVEMKVSKRSGLLALALLIEFERTKKPGGVEAALRVAQGVIGNAKNK